MSNVIPVTRTKIMVPRRRSEILSRQRLLGLLDELLEYRLIILAAPAGYGKTSLLIDFASSTQWPFCWYSLDTHDRDPLRFFAHLISALSQRFPKFGKSPLAALESMGQDNLNLDALISLVINDIFENITEHFVLVLDDYHLVENQKDIQYFINRFIQDVDENCHLILASRVLLTLPDLTLMVARSQVGGLSFEELTFQADEIQSLLRKNYNMAISDGEAIELAKETEGWVTGLLLSTQVQGKALANRLRVARVSGVGLYDYMADQILSQQTAEIQAFLLRTSLLDEFDEALCEEIIGRALSIEEDWRALMDVVLRSSLFILPVGEDGSFLRYHHLFQEFLRGRIRRERPEEARLILLQLALMYIQREEWERAYLIYQEQGERDAVINLVEQAGASMISQGRVLTLSEWLLSLPTDLLYQHPSLVSLQGTVTVSRGDTRQGIKLLDQAVNGLRMVGDPASLAHTLYRRSTAYRMVGQYTNALSDAEEALQLLQPEGQKNVVYADALLSKGTVLYSLGQLNEALGLMQKSLSAYQSLGDESTAAKVWIEIGRVTKTLGKYMDAEEAYKRALSHYQNTGNLNWQANLYNNLGVLQHDRSDYAAATSSFEKAIQYARMGGSVRLESYALASIGDLYQELDADQEALEAYRQARVIAQKIPERYLLLYLNLMEARLKLSQQDLEGATEYIQAARAQAEERGAQHEQQICRLEWGRLLLTWGRKEEALAEFNTALAFLVHQQYEVDIPRARMYAMVASALTGAGEIAGQHAAILQQILSEPEKLKLLIAAGREARPYLEQMRNEPQMGSFISFLLAQLEKHEQNIPVLRRLIRRHAVVVPFAPPKVTIRAFGKVQVKLSDHLVTGSEWQVQAARDLFFLLLAHPEGLTKEQIGEIFWPESSSGELKLRFKNTIYRLRHAAGKDAILFEGDSLYLFNRNLDYEYDAESFTKEIALAVKAKDSSQSAVHYKNAIRSYRGRFLPDVDMDWADVDRERYHQQYLDGLISLAKICLENREYDQALEHISAVLKEDNIQEEAHRIAMAAHQGMGNRAMVIRQYELLCQALDDELGEIPSKQTVDFYKSLV